MEVTSGYGETLPGIHMFDVLIVGAGIAGLSCAQELRSQDPDLRVAILEADNRIGGRIKTINFGGSTLEEGANWIHGRNKLYDYVVKKGLTVHECKTEASLLFDHTTNQPVKDGVYKKCAEWIEEFYGYVDKKAHKQPVDTKVVEYYDKFVQKKKMNAKEKRCFDFFIGMWIENDFNNTLSNLSALCFNISVDHPGGWYAVTEGYSRVTDLLSEDLDIRTNHDVETINYSGDMVSLTLRNQSEYFARKVVVTVSVGVIKNDFVKFNPTLPTTKEKALSLLQMGDDQRISMEFEEAFWSEDHYFFGINAEKREDQLLFYSNHKASKNNILTVFFHPAFTRKSYSLSDRELVDIVIERLKVVYTQCTKPIRFMRTHWKFNNTTCGTYAHSVMAEGDRDAHDMLADDIDKKVFFAGEATSTEYWGTCHGAFESGMREGLKVYNVLKSNNNIAKL